MTGCLTWLSRVKTAKARYSLLDERPLICVIVPGYNQAGVITQCVESILASRYLRMEVILVDGGSTDSTASIMEGMAQQHDRVRFLPETNAGKGEALNRGIAAAFGDVLMVVEADTICAPETLLHMLKGFDHPKVGAVCPGSVSTGPMRRAWSFLHGPPVVSGIGAFRNEVVRKVGSFDEDTHDLALTRRVHKAGYRVRVQPLAVVSAPPA